MATILNFNKLANQDININAGDAYIWPFQVLAADGVTPVDLSGVGVVIEWNYALSPGGLPPVAAKTLAGGAIAFNTDGTDGKCNLTIAAADLPHPMAAFHAVRVSVVANYNAAVTHSGALNVAPSTVKS